MSMFINSLKRLYVAGKIVLAKLDTFLTEGKVTQEEYNYIASQKD